MKITRNLKWAARIAIILFLKIGTGLSVLFASMWKQFSQTGIAPVFWGYMATLWGSPILSCTVAGRLTWMHCIQYTSGAATVGQEKGFPLSLSKTSTFLMGLLRSKSPLEQPEQGISHCHSPQFETQCLPDIRDLPSHKCLLLEAYAAQVYFLKCMLLSCNYLESFPFCWEESFHWHLFCFK